MRTRRPRACGSQRWCSWPEPSCAWAGAGLSGPARFWKFVIHGKSQIYSSGNKAVKKSHVPRSCRHTAFPREHHRSFPWLSAEKPSPRQTQAAIALRCVPAPPPLPGALAGRALSGRLLLASSSSSAIPPSPWPELPASWLPQAGAPQHAVCRRASVLVLRASAGVAGRPCVLVKALGPLAGPSARVPCDRVSSARLRPQL